MGMLRQASMMPAALQSALKLSYLECLNFAPAPTTWRGLVAANYMYYRNSSGNTSGSASDKHGGALVDAAM